MSQPLVLALGAVDGERIAGTAGIDVTWAQLGQTAPGDRRVFRAAFGRGDDTFRRLDRASRTLVLAGEAAGLSQLLPSDVRATTGLVLETTLGCLDADLEFAASMAAGMCDGALFAYTLPSTGLGELALRHGLRGPTTCLSTEPAQRGAGLREAELMLATDECDHVVVAMADVLARAHGPWQPGCRAVVALLAAARVGGNAVAAWPAQHAGGYDTFVAALAARTSHNRSGASE